MRGHNLVWPGWQNLPRDLQGLRSDAAALRRRVADHVQDEAAAIAGHVVDWDVINEPDGNHDLMDVLGKDVMVEWFRLAHLADPAARLFLNEATAPDVGLRQSHLEETVQWLLEQGAPLGGIGFQCHFGMNVLAPERALATLDRFARFGLPVQVTEFDIDTMDEELQGDYTRDFLLAAFSHPAIDALLMWGFWEGRHWRPEAAVYRRNWEPKPNARAWEDLVKGEWWTQSEGQTDSDGVVRVRGFLGDYDVQIDVRGQTKTVATTLTQPGTTVTVQI